MPNRSGKKTIRDTDVLPTFIVGIAADRLPEKDPPAVALGRMDAGERR